MQQLSTFYSYSFKYTPMKVGTGEITKFLNDLKTTESIVCIQHQNTHKCVYDKHLKYKVNVVGFHNCINIRMKYKDVMIPFKIFLNDKVRFTFTSITPLDVNDIINKFLKEVPIQHNYNNDHVLLLKINTFRLKEKIDINSLITYLGDSCISEIREPRSNLTSENYVVKLYKTKKFSEYITIRGKIISYCSGKDEFDKEILEKIKKFIGYKVEENNKNDEECKELISDDLVFSISI